MLNFTDCHKKQYYPKDTPGMRIIKITRNLFIYFIMSFLFLLI